jgi:hypothetical protein
MAPRPVAGFVGSVATAFADDGDDDDSLVVALDGTVVPLVDADDLPTDINDDDDDKDVSGEVALVAIVGAFVVDTVVVVAAVVVVAFVVTAVAFVVIVAAVVVVVVVVVVGAGVEHMTTATKSFRFILYAAVVVPNKRTSVRSFRLLTRSATATDVASTNRLRD